jgi:indole-3-glycerol phosphate synthase
MATTLDQIVAAARRRVPETVASANLRQLERQAEQHKPRGFRASLERASQTGVAIIAELKKASPSKGTIRAQFDPATLAKEFEAAGASALSVLTDEPYFQGSLSYLQVASSVTKLPCLRKDFIVDEFQLLEAKAYGADAVLLIVAALSQQELIGLLMKARSYGLDALCEAHDEVELQRAIDAGAGLIGVNSRDLRTFEVNLDTAMRLAARIPSNVTSVAESGIHTGPDLSRLRAAGYHAFLIGESLMKAEIPGQALQRLIAEAGAPLAMTER